MTKSSVLLALPALWLAALPFGAKAGLTPVDIWTGNVGLSIDAVGGNNTPVGNVQATIPAGATILAAYLYSAGTPRPWYSDSPNSTATYNSAGITLAGTPVTNFTSLVGATSDRSDLGQWFTGRADVTALVQSLAIGGPNYNWAIGEGSALNSRIDGEVLAIVYQHSSLPTGSVVLLDGGQKTGGETTTVQLGSPLGNVAAPGFVADMSLAISFSATDPQNPQFSTVDINGTRLTSAAGGRNDGAGNFDGALITAGGIGDSNANPSNPFSNTVADDEFYDLRPFLQTGATSFNILTRNPSNDDNVFLMGLRTTADIISVNAIPEPTGALFGLALAGVAALSRRRK
jgi:uncharacterized protein (TIGR03382 family)